MGCCSIAYIESELKTCCYDQKVDKYENKTSNEEVNFYKNSLDRKDLQQDNCDTREASTAGKINEIAIRFRGDFDDHLLMFNKEITLREMFTQFLLQYTSIRSLDIDKIFFINNSRILNNPNYIDKSLKNISGIRNNSIIRVIIPGQLVSSD